MVREGREPARPQVERFLRLSAVSPMAASEIGARKTTSVADGEALGAATLGLVEG